MIVKRTSANLKSKQAARNHPTPGAEKADINAMPAFNGWVVLGFQLDQSRCIPEALLRDGFSSGKAASEAFLSHSALIPV
jgi:hypothetical protein